MAGKKSQLALTLVTLEDSVVDEEDGSIQAVGIDWQNFSMVTKQSATILEQKVAALEKRIAGFK